MKNKLEDFVKRNREEFDSDIPVNDLWRKIDKTPAASKAKIFNFFTRTQVAASLLVLLNAAIVFFLLQRNPASAPAPAAAHTEQLAPENHEAASEETIDEISRVVEIKQAKLKEIERSNPVLYKKFTGALGELNNTYKQLEKELDKNPNKEQLLEAMIQNLGLQQELLNQQLSIYQKIKQHKNEKANKNI